MLSAETMVGDGTKGCRADFSHRILMIIITLTAVHSTASEKLLSLNLCNNKLYQLDGLSDIIQNVPTIIILNFLSKNEVRGS